MTIDALNVIRSVSTICGCEALTELGPRAVTPLMHAFQASSLLLLSSSPKLREDWGKALVVVNQAPSTLQRYFERHCHADPVINHWQRHAQDECRVFRLSDLTAPVDPSYRAFLRSANVAHILLLSIPLGRAANEHMLVAIHRDERAKDFTGDECQIGEYLAPVLRQSFRAMQREEDEHAWLDVSSTFVSKVSRQPLLLVDEGGQLLDASHGARTHPAYARLAKGDRAFNVAIDQFLSSSLNTQELTVDGADDALRLSLRRVEGLSRYVLVTLNPSGGDAPALAWELLTPRQLEVARLVAKGARNCQVAECLGVSENTVVNHLSTVFGKLNIKSRTALAASWHRTMSDA
ncbi:MAG: LuxR C-terminal-related transcriptional regulator [Pseudomonadota bacterium]